MGDPAALAAAAAAWDRLAAQPTTPPADGARAALALSRALEAADRLADAQAAAEAGIRALAAPFEAAPEPLAEPMRALVAQYLGLAQRSRVAADRALLAPIAVTLGQVVTAEDGADAGDPT